ncbi:MAG: NFACT RNA binding domain-containing protein [Sporomusaceae bacterium]|nr:NFACT RNA binding domain-containing protein [Sporomusaceae bacterium]
MNLDGLSLSALVSELQQTLYGGRIEKIFQPDAYSLTVYVRIPGQTVQLAISADPQRPRLHLSGNSSENPDTPPTFCMLLRKHLTDGRISAIVQHSLDRTVMLNIDVREEGGTIAVKTLVIELMGKHSNIIFVQNETIIDAIRRVGPAMSRFRLVLPGQKYQLPPGQDKLNLLQANTAALVEAVCSQPATLSKAIMNLTIGIGPVTVKEVLWRAELAPESTAAALDATARDKLQAAFDSVLTPLKTAAVIPHVRVTPLQKVSAFAAFRLHYLPDACHEFTSMSQAADFILSLTPQAPPARERLQKFVASELKRLQRKNAVLNEEQEQADAADEWRRKADILMTFLSELQPGQPRVTLPDIYADQPGISVEIELEPLATPARNAQLYYTRYQKQKRAQENLRTQLEQLSQELAYLESVQCMLEQAQSARETREIEEELIAGGYLSRRSKRKPEAVSAPLTLALAGGGVIIVGKNNRQNDLVTFKLSRPDDIWFHTKDIPGSHVLLRPSGAPDAAALQTAAMVAAYFSKARHSSQVPVDYTLRRYVKKPSGAKPGFVIYDRQTTLFVTPQEAAVTALLNSGQKPNRDQ